MDFHELEAFIALADTLHFAQAAAQIHLSPSALSRLVGRLEEEFGVAFFARDTRQVSLTPEGTVFLSFARDCVYRRDDIRLRLSQSDDRLRGILRVYASVTACYSILPPLAEALAREHPALKLSVETGDPSDAADAIREGRAELALDALPPNGYRDIECFSVRKSPLVFVASKSGAFGDLTLEIDKISPKNSGLLAASLEKKPTNPFTGIPLILPKAGPARERFERWARLRGIKPDIAAEAAGNEAVLALVRLGLGLGLVPRIVLENSPFGEGLTIYGAGPEIGEYDIGFMQKTALVGTEAAKKTRLEIARIIRKTYLLG